MFWCLGVFAFNLHLLAADELERGIKLLSGGKFTEALDALNRFKQTAPGDARPYFYSGMALTEAGRLSDAALEIGEAVRLDPSRAEYLIFQANIFSRLKQNAHAANALAPFEKEDRLKQLDAAWLYLLSDVYQRLDKTDRALEALALLSERSPADARVDLKRGQIFLARGEFDSALAAFKKTIEKQRANADAHFQLGRILYQRNEMEAARKAMLEAVRLDPGNPGYLHKLGLVCLAQNQPREAMEYLARAEPSASTFPEIYYALANACQRSGDRVKAAEYRARFREVTLARRKKEDQDREAGKLIAQGERELDEGREAAAKSLFARALEMDPDNWSAHGYLAEMHLASGDLQLAYPHLLRMEELDRDSVVGNYLMARYWHRRNEHEKARDYAERVKLFRPGHAELRNLLGSIYLGLGQHEKARQEFEAAVRLAPDRADFRDNLRQVEKSNPP